MFSFTPEKLKFSLQTFLPETLLTNFCASTQKGSNKVHTTQSTEQRYSIHCSVFSVLYNCSIDSRGDTHLDVVEFHVERQNLNVIILRYYISTIIM